MKRHVLQLTLVCTFTSAIFVLTLNAASAAPPSLPPRPVPNPTPTEMPAESKPIGAWIQFRGPAPVTQDVWAVVQWQDSLDNWNDIESWRGQYDSATDGVGLKTWWVDQTLFGASMFRWTIYDKKTGQVIGSTAAFSLPSSKNQTMITVLQ